MNTEERRLLAIKLRIKHNKSFQEIGNILGVTRQRAHQLLQNKQDRVRLHFSEYIPDSGLRVERDRSVYNIVGLGKHCLGPYQTVHGANEMLALLQRAYLVLVSPSSGELEIARVLNELLVAGLSQTQIATIFHKQETWISFICKLNRLPESLLRCLDKGKVRATSIIKVSDRYGAIRAERAVKAILAIRPGKVTEREINEYMKNQGIRAKKASDRKTVNRKSILDGKGIATI